MTLENADAAEGAIELAEMLLGVTCAAAGAEGGPEGLPPEPSKFTPSERALLRTFSPGVGPHLGAAATSSPEVAIAGFLGTTLYLAWKRWRAIRAAKRSDVKEPTAPAPSATQGAAIPTSTLEHKRLWGSASDAVKPGTPVVDVGLPPRFRPSPP